MGAIEWITNNIETVLGSGLVGTGIGWLANRKKDKAEVAVIETEAETAKQAIYDKLLLDNKNRIEDLIKEVTELRFQMKEFRNLTDRLQEELDDCRQNVNKANRLNKPKN
jgi:predicted RNase H-like nuclease (RuvC/YqgF family)